MYANIDDEKILDDIDLRKEFYALKGRHRPANPAKTSVSEMLTRAPHVFQPYTYQSFMSRFLNPSTPYMRAFGKWGTGAGKTIGAILTALAHITALHESGLAAAPTNASVYIIGFEGTRRAFMKDLLKYPAFGFASPAELETAARLRAAAAAYGAQEADINADREYSARLRRRLTNRKGNGLFKFIGYKALVNQLFPGASADADLRELYNAGHYNKEFLESFKHGLLICDEFHDVYNSLQSNNWGTALQIVGECNPTAKMLALSATPLNNAPREVLDLLKHLHPTRKFVESDYFLPSGELAPGADAKLRADFTGVMSYIVDKDPSTFPARSFIGDSIKGIPFLKFIRCPMGAAQQDAYKSVIGHNHTLTHDNIYVLDFALPAPEDPDAPKKIFRAADMKYIGMAPPQWKTANNIDLTENNIVTGECLRLGVGLEQISSKYAAMMRDLIDILTRRGGKCLLFHNYVNMSGAEFLKEVLLRNGIIDERMAPAPATLCSLCGKRFDEHTAESSHVPKPARFLIVHSDIDKATTAATIDRFVRPSNAWGDEFFVLIGTPMIKQSYDLKCVCNVFVMSRPDNISQLIQIYGRAARAGSHIGLPQSMWHVFIRLYVASLQDGSLAYEELKYKEKMHDYMIIQRIEKIMHECAVDADINHPIIAAGQTREVTALDDLPFKPLVSRKYSLKELNVATFMANGYANKEIDLAAQIIKRAFVETSPVWKYDDLLKHVRDPPHAVEYNTSLISEDSVIIALSRLLDVTGSSSTRPRKNAAGQSIVDAIYDPFAKRIGNATIRHIGEFYMLVPGKAVVDAPYRAARSSTPVEINIRAYMSKSAALISYEQRKQSFRDKYEDVSIANMEGAICDYGAAFHVQFAEEMITYIFNQWTHSIDKSDFHQFYFKMLYYYDIMGLIIFADTTRDYVYAMYKEYIDESAVSDVPAKPSSKSPSKSSSKSSKSPKPLKTQDTSTRNLLRLIERNIAKSSCEWCPQSTKEQYEETLQKSLDRLSAVDISPDDEITPVAPDLLPVGHYFEKIPKFYHPARGWFSLPEYTATRRQWIENPIVIGFDVKVGIHIRFKLRRPAQFIVAHTDARRTEKGSACITQDKKWLLTLCKKLNIENMLPTTPVVQICQDIKARLMYLELLERSRGSNIKFYYNHFET